MSEFIDKEALAEKFPSNSNKSKTEMVPEKPPTKKIEKVITGTAKQKKKGFGKRLAEIFLEDDSKSVGNYILHDVLIPAAKSMISDMVGGGIEMLLFGEKRGTRTRREGNRSYTSYGSAYQSSIRDRDKPRERDRRDISTTSRARHDFGEIILETRGEAEMVLSHMVDQIVEYGVVSVADLYALVDIESSYVDGKYGWYELHGDDTYASRLRNGGYRLNLPKPSLID